MRDCPRQSTRVASRSVGVDDSSYKLSHFMHRCSCNDSAVRAGGHRSGSGTVDKSVLFANICMGRMSMVRACYSGQGWASWQEVEAQFMRGWSSCWMRGASNSLIDLSLVSL
jgi:hypothetical protein